MNLQRLISTESQRLKDAGYVHGDREVAIILSKLLGIDSNELFNRYDNEVSPALAETLEKQVSRRLKGEPVAYIVGTQQFMSWEFLSDHRALIPRPETETLTETVIRLIRAHHLEGGKFLEIGTGAGIISICLKKHFPEAEITATDISDEALELAEENAKRLKVDVKFVESDLFQNVPKDKYDLIVANLPYVPTQKLDFVSDQILDWEPMVAIEAGEDGLKYLEPFLRQAPKFLKKDGIIALEFWHTHGDRVCDMVEKYLSEYGVKIEKDLAGFDRYAIIQPK
ncbi:MAG TPA: peptide chain release factor N(5)-glutamine methyltransferase [Candidatus Saccharimonadales bacterium]|nr:peptide chain release factor N(5)-glutamine methyltransferase [Candidatus Saccharimonadales bacterium]